VCKYRSADSFAYNREGRRRDQSESRKGKHILDAKSGTMRVLINERLAAR
jgi:hypothetical protein